MGRLPQELIDRISSYLTREDLKNTLLLSHAFRLPAEKYSGAFARFSLNRDTVKKFLGIFSGHRLSYLRDLQCAIRLPPSQYSDRRDDAGQLSILDRTFTEQIKLLFASLKSVEELAWDWNLPGRVRLAISPPRRPIFREHSLSYHDHLSWRVHLLEPEALPMLRSVRSLEIGAGWGGLFPTSADDVNYRWVHVKLDYRVMVDLVDKLPNLEYWGCRMGGDEWSPKTEQEATGYFTQDWAGPRRDTRQEFARELSSARLPESLRQIRLDFLHDLCDSTNIDHLTAQPDLVSPASSDLFSTTLHHLSHHLRRLHLRIVADETLFQPKDNCLSSWPNLESLIIIFHMVTPSGGWYFQGPNSEGGNTAALKVTRAAYPPLETTPYDEEMLDQIMFEGDRRYRGSPNSRFRIAPNESTLRPFLAAFAKAAAKMTALQEAALWCPLAWAPNDENGDDSMTELIAENCPDPTKLAWGFHFQAKSELDFTRRGGHLPTDVPLLWWKVGRWRPDPELHRLFQNIGGLLGDGGLEEHWEDEDYGDGLVDRDYFEYCVQEEVDKVGWIRLSS